MLEVIVGPGLQDLTLDLLENYRALINDCAQVSNPLTAFFTVPSSYSRRRIHQLLYIHKPSFLMLQNGE